MYGKPTVGVLLLQVRTRRRRHAAAGLGAIRRRGTVVSTTVRALGVTRAALVCFSVSWPLVCFSVSWHIF